MRIINRQRPRGVNTTLLRQLVGDVVSGLFPTRSGAVAVHVVSSRHMARINERFLGHQGPTDVITFDHAEHPSAGELCGEIFVSPEVARVQAPRYRTDWQTELTRHVVHGLLHLAGQSDKDSRARKAMKKQEDIWLSRLRRRFLLSRL